MKPMKIKSQDIRTLLIIFIVLAFILAGAVFYFGQEWAVNFAKGVNISKISENSISLETINGLRQELNDNQKISTKAKSLFAPLQDFQNKAVDDINKYANKTGITISSFDLKKSSKLSPTIIGATITYITISPKNPVTLTNLLKFLKLIETNIPKMQLSGITIYPKIGDKDSVNVDPITIQIYTK